MPIEKNNVDMFADIGKKIKGVARTTANIQIAISIIIAIFVCVVAFDDIEEYWWMFLLAIAIVIIGCAIAWSSAYLLYGFGELIDKTCDIEKNTRGNRKVLDPQPPVKQEQVEQAEGKMVFGGKASPIIPSCIMMERAITKAENVKVVTNNIPLDESTPFIDTVCPECGKELSFVSDIKNTECPYCNTQISIE